MQSSSNCYHPATTPPWADPLKGQHRFKELGASAVVRGEEDTRPPLIHRRVSYLTDPPVRFLALAFLLSQFAHSFTFMANEVEALPPGLCLLAGWFDCRLVKSLVTTVESNCLVFHVNVFSTGRNGRGLLVEFSFDKQMPADGAVASLWIWDQHRF